MSEVLALVRAHWLSQTSYRLRTIFGFVSILISIVPLYFISDALQPVMAESISDEGGQYFGFLVVGLIAMLLVSSGVNLLPGAVSAGISRGTFEAMLSTPTRLPKLLIGMIGAGLLQTFIRMIVLASGGWALGAPLQADSILPALLILFIILLAYLPFGLIAAAPILLFRTAGPLPRGVTYLSILLGGVYYPTKVIPDWIQIVSDFIPLSYGLRALRQVLLDGASLSSVAGDLGILAGFVIGLFTFGILAFTAAFRYAKKAGTLAQY